jgi:hypothetical protein
MPKTRLPKVKGSKSAKIAKIGKVAVAGAEVVGTFVPEVGAVVDAAQTAEAAISALRGILLVNAMVSGKSMELETVTDGRVGAWRGCQLSTISKHGSRPSLS